MSSGGMQVIKNRKLLVVILCGIIFVILLFVISILGKKKYPDSEFYDEKMFLLSETSSEVKLGDIFDFQFDKAYVSELISETYADEAYFLEELDVDTNIDIPTLESGVHYRILFVKDDTIIYDYIYYMSEVRIAETGIWIYPDTVLKLKQSNSIGLEGNAIRIEFENND